MSVLKIKDGNRWIPITSIKGESPVVTATKSGGVTTILVDDTAIATINDGEKGDEPVITASKSGGVTTIYADGVEIATLNDGQAGTTDYENLENQPSINSVTLTGNKTTSDLGLGTYTKPSGGIPKTDLASAVQNSIDSADSAYQKPSEGIPASDLADGVIPSVPVTDVTINGVSIVSGGEAVIPIAQNNGDFGLVKTADGTYGLFKTANGYLAVAKPTDAQIKAGTHDNRAIVPSVQHKSVFYGLAKVAGVDMSQSANAVGTYTTEAQTAIKSMLGVTDTPPEIFIGSTIPSGYTVYIDPDGSTVVGEGVSF